MNKFSNKKITHYCDKFDDCPHKFRKFCCAESLPIHKVKDFCEVDKSYNYDKSYNIKNNV